eukprot:CAMPEP_0195287034 /NCGR_PEP_ID=MMETSP0707-20130614/4266_1 /TAXON_ID=33640 /ORGANISM="Asterionellopsis glacialis, Strain CCMP134" /LENGTH=767 /DNA_ID=CAMNT_0040346751 /DNA_START=58 /DNA_END=2361 /DNA_ORIENTATION=-
MRILSDAVAAMLLLAASIAVDGFMSPPNMKLSSNRISTSAAESPLFRARYATSSSTPLRVVATETPEEAIAAVDEETKTAENKKTTAVSMDDLVEALENEAELVAEELIDEECEIDTTGKPLEDYCVDEGKMAAVKQKFKGIVKKTMKVVRLGSDEGVDEAEDDDDEFSTGVLLENVPEGEILEQGWERRGNSSALRRNGEVWKFALKCVFRALKPRKMRKSGASEEEIKAAQVEAATFIRDGLLELGPTFVKLGQVVSTRTDVLPPTYTDVLKSLQDDVPGFSGARAKEIVSQELGKDCDSVFEYFSEEPLAAASLGQVHTAMFKGKKVAIKVQRAGLKELFDVDLKNLKKLAVLLDKFDPKSDGADRDWVSIYEESERLLYLEIDYLNEATNAERFARDFADVEWVRVPDVYREVSTPRVLCMEFIESFKLTDIERIEKLGLDRKLLAKRTADAFLKQIVETSYFHCDPHAGNLCVDNSGNLVYYDFGMMDELKPNVLGGFRKFCTALFEGGPTISETELAKNAKLLVDGVEDAGVLARGADRLAVEKLARYFMRTFKDNQLGKKGANVKETVGTDLQTLTENNVFRFPSTFTFIFRAFASIEGIGKGLDKDYDIGKLAQPFIEKFTESQKGYKSQTEKNLNIFAKATGLNTADIETAVTSPRKIAYIEETLRAMESGTLKVRVRSLENEKSLERMALTQNRMENFLLASLFLNIAGIMSRPILTGTGVAGAAFFGLQAFLTNTKIKKFDKTQAKFVQTKFEGDD